jgi:2-phosphosulfolactate phosphatase
MFIEVIWHPGEFSDLKRRDLSRHTAVVFDVLRATSTELTALNNGAESVQPVESVEEALRLKREQPAVLLAGERDSFKPEEFDLGNSPLEFGRTIVCGKKIVHTTTNGTRALNACAHAKSVYLGTFLNLSAVAREILHLAPDALVLVCAGTHSHFALEDGLAAGALIGKLQSAKPTPAPSARGCLSLWRSNAARVAETVAVSRNGQRLRSVGLAADVEYCSRVDVVGKVARLGAGGVRLA